MASRKLRTLAWVQLAPLLLLALAVWVYRESQNEVWLQFSRAKECWREGRRQEALDTYKSVFERYPDSRYAPEALWELATIRYLHGDRLDLAAYYFGILGERYPEHPRSAPALYRQGDIYEKGLDNVNRALEVWKGLLSHPSLSAELRERTLLRLANGYYKSEDFASALNCLKELLDEPANRDLAQQGRVLAGTIAQLQHRYENSVDILRQVLNHPECPDCRLQARLALIQSYEFLNRLPQAIQVAESIPGRQLPPRIKQDLLRRLREKERLDR